MTTDAKSYYNTTLVARGTVMSRDMSLTELCTTTGGEHKGRLVFSHHRTKMARQLVAISIQDVLW